MSRDTKRVNQLDLSELVAFVDEESDRMHYPVLGDFMSDLTYQMVDGDMDVWPPFFDSVEFFMDAPQFNSAYVQSMLHILLSEIDIASMDIAEIADIDHEYPVERLNSAMAVLTKYLEGRKKFYAYDENHDLIVEKKAKRLKGGFRSILMITENKSELELHWHAQDTETGALYAHLLRKMPAVAPYCHPLDQRIRTLELRVADFYRLDFA